MAPAKGHSYADVLARAIDDITIHGYDSVERINYWVGELKRAAERTMRSAAAVDNSIRDSLSQVYRRMIERGLVLKYHPGVSEFTIEKLRPQLRNELDRAILSSANLIKLNREKRMAETLQRFSGWATSIPKGGSKVVDKRDEKQNIKKPIAQIKFEQRRVEIDQGHKLVASINRIVAEDGGAIACKWVSHWRQAGYDYREDHKDRDHEYTGKVYLIRNCWAHSQGFVKPMPGAGYYDQITAAGEEPFCRCYVVYIYALRDMPDDMLTAKGRSALAQARAKVKALLS